MPLLAPLATRLEAVEKAVGSLAGVRQTLMLKYDAAASSALNKAEMLDQQLRETKRLLDVDTQVRKLAAEVGRLVDWSRHGPRSAVVTDVRVEAEPPENISGFQIR